MVVTIYRNKENHDKYLEVHRYSCSHATIRQFMYWEDCGVRNMLGDTFLHRITKVNLTILLSDYERVCYCDIEEGLK